MDELARPSAGGTPAFKSELAIRPLFHQPEKRVKAHVLVAFLDYALRGDAETSTEAKRFGIFAG